MSPELLTQVVDRLDMLLLLFLRMSGLFITAPIWSNRLVPLQLRVMLAGLIAVVVSPLFPALPPETSVTTLVVMAVRELTVGLVIGFVAALAFSAVQLAGQLLDINMGLSMMNVLDPMTNSQVPIMGNFLYIVGLLIFFTVNGHHVLLQALMDSYAFVPMGSGALTPALSQSVVSLGGKVFMLGFQIAAPVLAAVLLTTVALGILNRAVHQMNVFVIGLPVQLAVGVFMMIVVLPLYIAFLRVVFSGMFDDLRLVIRLLKG